MVANLIMINHILKPIRSTRIVGIYGYKVVCCYNDKYSKPATIYKGEKAVYKFMEAMPEEVKYCRKVNKNCFVFLC